MNLKKWFQMYNQKDQYKNEQEILNYRSSQFLDYIFKKKFFFFVSKNVYTLFGTKCVPINFVFL